MSEVTATPGTTAIVPATTESGTEPTPTKKSGTVIAIIIILLLIIGLVVGVVIYSKSKSSAASTSSTSSSTAAPSTIASLAATGLSGTTGGTTSGTTTASGTGTTGMTSASGNTSSNPIIASSSAAPMSSTTVPATASTGSTSSTSSTASNSTAPAPNPSLQVIASGTALLGSMATNVASQSFQITFPNGPLTSVPDIVCTPLASNASDFPDTFVDTIYNVTATGFTVKIVRADVTLNTWGEQLQLDWLAYTTPSPISGIAMIGPGVVTGVQTFNVSFGATFSSTPNVVCTPTGQVGSTFPDTFSMSIVNINPTGFSVQIYREDAPGATWIQSLQLAWLAFTNPSNVTGLQGGLSPITANPNGGVTMTNVTIPTAFTAAPVVICNTITSAGQNQTFANTVYSITNTGFSVTTARTDVFNGSWTQAMQLAWIAYGM